MLCKADCYSYIDDKLLPSCSVKNNKNNIDREIQQPMPLPDVSLARCLEKEGCVSLILYYYEVRFFAQVASSRFCATEFFADSRNLRDVICIIDCESD
jgi:hypothetical protein